jgi:hypothetical protein
MSHQHPAGINNSLKMKDGTRKVNLSLEFEISTYDQSCHVFREFSQNLIAGDMRCLHCSRHRNCQK